MDSAKNRGFFSGLLLVVIMATIAWGIGMIPFVGKVLKISPLIIGILLGMVYANTLRARMPESWVPGVKFCSKRILRLAIVFYGFRLTLGSIVSVGVSALVIDVLIVTSVILLGIFVGKILRLDKETALLAAVGSAVCGAAAVLGAESVVKAKPEKTVIAVATVVIFGTISMLLYPILYSMGVFDLSPQVMGIYTGSTLHEVAHVAGAGEAMSTASGVPELAGIATITKMIRVILLAPVLLIISFFLNRRKGDQGGDRSRIAIPWFAIWFMIIIGLNTLLLHFAEVLNISEQYRYIISVIEKVDTFALTMAMTALGMDAMFAKFREAGLRPFIMAGILFLWLIGFGYLLVNTIPVLLA
ncbi:YeiH family protein [Porphyromonas sp.]|uniref:YeiH family protein n=1 Tax=Porphyromonas sp. TaxID=1924944 RepID=UPI0026DD180E|nr:YeiH family protein [Porphyromonas sp.]MDO4771237.1 YeiH family protein [Porphyromonas sp.]